MMRTRRIESSKYGSDHGKHEGMSMRSQRNEKLETSVAQVEHIIITLLLHI